MSRITKTYSPEYNTPHLAGAVNPAAVQVPGDVTPTGPALNAGDGLSIQLGKLTNQVSITYPDGHVLVFPVNSQVSIYRQDGNIDNVILDIDNQGHPKPVQQGGRRRTRRHRRRSTRRRRVARRQ